jgi:hypothetical protein
MIPPEYVRDLATGSTPREGEHPTKQRHPGDTPLLTETFGADRRKCQFIDEMNPDACLGVSSSFHYWSIMRIIITFAWAGQQWVSGLSSNTNTFTWSGP